MQRVKDLYDELGMPRQQKLWQEVRKRKIEVSRNQANEFVRARGAPGVHAAAAESRRQHCERGRERQMNDGRGEFPWRPYGLVFDQCIYTYGLGEDHSKQERSVCARSRQGAHRALAGEAQAVVDR